METVEPGIYRIVHKLFKKAVNVAAAQSYPIPTVVGWQPLNLPTQEWLVQRSGEGYHISDRVHGRYIQRRGTSDIYDRKAELGAVPTLWEFVPGEKATWRIKLMGYDLVLSLVGGQNGDTIVVDHSSSFAYWRLERLGDLAADGPADGPGLTQLGTTEKDHIIEQMAEQLAQQGKQLTELAGQLADQNQKTADQYQRIEDQNQRFSEQLQKHSEQNQRVPDQSRTIMDQIQTIADQSQTIVGQSQAIADQNQMIEEQNRTITNQEGEISNLKKQIEEKDQQLAQANREVRYLLARVTQREEPLDQDRVAMADSSRVTERVKEEGTPL